MTTIADKDLRVTKKDEEAYYKEAASWDGDMVTELRNSRRWAWRAFSAMCAVAVLEAAGLAGLVPLKSVEPFVVRVDNSTGIVDQVVRLRDAKETYDEVMTKFFLRQVVTLRETYTRTQLQRNYDNSVLFTAPSARPQLKADFSFDNPNGPYKVRYLRIDRKSGAEVQSRWVATVEFRYVSQPASEDARGVNPLGFQVTNYRNDPEAFVEAPKQ
jgi:type IV secretion system protein VirB8